MDESRAKGVTRRESLVKLGGFAAAALGAGALRQGWPGQATEASAAAGGPAGVASGAVTCVLIPEQTEGPYYIQSEKRRRNITEGRPGTRLMLELPVLDASTCAPIPGALVDVWHCDAAGAYSGFGGIRNRSFLRGRQPSDANGVATFQTVYPGWYPGRTVHVHVKVYITGNVVHTGQLYFSDDITDVVYLDQPYAQRGARDTRNADDAIFRNGGKLSLLTLEHVADGWVGSIDMGVHTS